MPNPRFEGTAGKQGLPVPRRLRRRAAPQAKRWAAQISTQQLTCNWEAWGAW